MRRACHLNSLSEAINPTQEYVADFHAYSFSFKLCMVYSKIYEYLKKSTICVTDIRKLIKQLSNFLNANSKKSFKLPNSTNILLQFFCALHTVSVLVNKNVHPAYTTKTQPAIDIFSIGTK